MSYCSEKDLQIIPDKKEQKNQKFGLRKNYHVIQKVNRKNNSDKQTQTNEQLTVREDLVEEPVEQK